MDIVNFPGIIAEHGLLSSAQVDLAKDLILIGKKMGSQRDGTQYENMAISVLDLVALASGGAQTLAQTLALGNITGGLNVVFSGGSQAVFNSGAFSGGLTTLALTGNQTWSLPNQSGTIALLSDIPGPDLTLYNGDGTIGTNRIATLTDNLQFASTSGGINILHGIGADPLGFGEGGILSYVTMTPAANVEAYGGVRIISGEPTWCHQVYDAINNNEAGTYVGWSTAQSNPYSAIYYYNATTDDYFGFEANAFGEQLYSQRTALVTTTLTAADRVLFVSNAGGYLKATTYADLAAQLPINTFYTGNGSTVGARTVTLGGALQFNHGALGVNGYVQMLTGGYFRNNGANPNNYFEFNHNTNIFTVNTTTATVSGYVASNNAAYLRADVSSGAYAGITISGATNELGFYVDGGLKYAGGIRGGSGAFNGSWGFGIAPSAGAKVHILSESGQGYGTIIATDNLSPAEYILQIRDAAGFGRLGVSATGVTTIDYRLWVGTNLGSIPIASTFAVKGTDSSFLTRNSAILDGSNNTLWEMMNNGNIGHNIAPNTLDRMFIRAGSGYNGAINISAFNLAANGYSVLAQGGLGVAGTYNGIWSDAIGGATVDNRAFYGVSGVAGPQNSIGGEFRARNGSQFSIGVYGRAIGGDSINPSQQVIGVWGQIEALVASWRFAMKASIFQAGTTNLATSNGLDVNIQYTSGVATESVHGVYTLVRVNGAGVTNRAAFFQASGIGGATNHALVTTGGNVGFGTASPNASAIVDITSTTQGLLLPRMNAAQAALVAPVNGLVIYVTNTGGVFVSIGFWGYENSAWVKL